MGIESLLRDMKRDVSAVSGVQPSNGAGLRDTSGTYQDVSDVSANLLHWRPDTSDTAATKEPYRLKPAPALACTSDTGDTSQKRCEQRNVAVFRRWLVRDPGGQTWDVTQTPAATAAELAATWPAGTALEPVPDAPTQPACPPLDGATEARIQRWLASIGEVDPAIIGEVLDLCADDPAILAMYLGLAGDVPDELPLRDVKCCGTCTHYQRTSHPRLGTCRAGEPPPNCGQFWDSDLRSCDQWGMKP